MLGRLDVHLTSCRPQVVVQQYLGFLRRVSNIAIQTLMANNAGTFRRASDKLPSTGCSTNLGFLRPVSNIAIPTLMANNVVRLDVHLTSCRPQVVVQQYLGFLRRVFNIAIQELMANNAGTFRRVSKIAM